MVKTELNTWFERDRAMVELVDAETGETIIDWWDEAVSEAMDEGFLVFGRGDAALHRSAIEYAEWLGLL